MDLDTLATREKVEYDDGIKGALTTAHPAIYPDGSIYNLFQEVGAVSSSCALRFRNLGSCRLLFNTYPTSQERD